MSAQTLTTDPAERAMRAYFRRNGAGAQQPTEPSMHSDGKGGTYIVLHNRHGVLGSYHESSAGARLQFVDQLPDDIRKLYA